jgi:hypothetical protein
MFRRASTRQVEPVRASGPTLDDDDTRAPGRSKIMCRRGACAWDVRRLHNRRTAATAMPRVQNRRTSSPRWALWLGGRKMCLLRRTILVPDGGHPQSTSRHASVAILDACSGVGGRGSGRPGVRRAACSIGIGPEPAHQRTARFIPPLSGPWIWLMDESAMACIRVSRNARRTCVTGPCGGLPPRGHGSAPGSAVARRRRKSSTSPPGRDSARSPSNGQIKFRT